MTPEPSGQSYQIQPSSNQQNITLPNPLCHVLLVAAGLNLVNIGQWALLSACVTYISSMGADLLLLLRAAPRLVHIFCKTEGGIAKIIKNQVFRLRGRVHDLRTGILSIFSLIKLTKDLLGVEIETKQC